MQDKADKPVSPGSTATGSGTSMGEADAQKTRRDEGTEGLEDLGTTEADISDGREQKQPRVD